MPGKKPQDKGLNTLCKLYEASENAEEEHEEYNDINCYYTLKPPKSG